MKLQSELKHKIVVENEDGVEVEFAIDVSDMIQMASITELFAEYDEVMKLDFKPSDNDSLQDILNKIRPVKKGIQRVNELMDEVFGKEITETAFKGSSSMILYNDFFNKLGDELNKAGVKTEAYVKKVRKEMLVNDHKGSNTI